MSNKINFNFDKPIKLIGNYWLAGIVIILLVFSIGLNFKSTEYSDSGLLLGFIGILATFIVVGNYAQVMNIKKDSDEKIEELNVLIVEQNKKNEEINKEINGIEAGINGALMHIQGVSYIDKDKKKAYQCFVEAAISYNVALSHEYSIDRTLPNLETVLKAINSILSSMSKNDYLEVNATPNHNLNSMLSSIQNETFCDLTEQIRKTIIKRDF